MTDLKLEKKLKEYENRISTFEKEKSGLIELRDNYQSQIQPIKFKTLKIGTGIGTLVGLAVGVAVSAFDYLSRGYIGAETYALSSCFVVGGSFAGLVAGSLDHDLPFGANNQADMEIYKERVKEVNYRLDYTTASLESYRGHRESYLDSLYGLLRNRTDTDFKSKT